MRPRSLITVILGMALTVMGLVSLVIYRSATGAIPLLIGGSLVYLGWCGGRTATLVFGHTTIVIGCAMITWGIYLLPYSQPTLSHILAHLFSGASSHCLVASVPTIMGSARVFVGKSELKRSETGR